MRRRAQRAVACTAIILLFGVTTASAKGKPWLSDDTAEWASSHVSFTGTVPCGPVATPGTLVLGALPNTFRLTDVAIGNPGVTNAAETIGVADTTGTRFTAVVGAGGTFTDTFRVALILATGNVTVSCVAGATDVAYVTISGKLEGTED